MIKFVPVIDDIPKYQKCDLPSEAVKLDTPSSEAMQIKALPILIIPVIILFLSMRIKTVLSGISGHMAVINPISLILGFVIGFILLIVHELLHAMAYPKEAEVTIGKLKGKLIFVALASFPLKRSRFILMCLLPFILGIVPLVLFFFTPYDSKFINGLLFGIAAMGLVSPYPDVYNVLLVLRQSGKRNRIMFYEDDMYRIAEEEG